MYNRPSLDDDMWLLYCAGDEDDKKFAGTYFSIRFWIDFGIIAVIAFAIFRGVLYLIYPHRSLVWILKHWFVSVNWAKIVTNPTVWMLMIGTIIYTLVIIVIVVAIRGIKDEYRRRKYER